MPVRRGCGYCNPAPGKPYAPTPDEFCEDCYAREWAPFAGRHLDQESWRVLSGLLDQRCGGRCEACGEPFVVGVREINRHHRRAIGRGGTHDPVINGLANVLLLCAGANARLGGAAGCHGSINAAGDSLERGLVVPWGAYQAGAGRPPEVDAVLVLPSGRRVLLDPLSPYYLPAPGPAYAV